MLYTSSNGYMYSTLNKEGQLGIRLPKEIQQKFHDTYGDSTYRSYGAVMRDYALIPDELLQDEAQLAEYLKQGLDFVNGLPPK